MLDQPGGAVRTLEAIAAVPAQRQRRIAAPVEEQQRLLALVEPRAHLLDQPRREPAATLGRLDPQVENSDLGQHRAAETRRQRDPAIDAGIGKVTFDANAIKENLEALLSDLKRAKPAAAKGIYLKKITLSTTMGPGLVIDQGSLEA